MHSQENPFSVLYKYFCQHTEKKRILKEISVALSLKFTSINRIRRFMYALLKKVK